MKITLSPQRRDDVIGLVKKGDKLTLVQSDPAKIQEFDFSSIPEGATLPADAIDSEFFAGPVERIDGELHMTLVLPHGPDASEAARFPQPVTVTADGVINLPK